MAQFTVRNIEDDILREALEDDGPTAGPGLGSRIAARFERAGRVDSLPELRGQPEAG